MLGSAPTTAPIIGAARAMPLQTERAIAAAKAKKVKLRMLNERSSGPERYEDTTAPACETAHRRHPHQPISIADHSKPTAD